MNYPLIKETIALLEEFDIKIKSGKKYSGTIDGFKNWIADQYASEIKPTAEPNWEGKEEGRTPESVINTLIVHMNRYAKTYSKSALAGSAFSTQEEFIFLINLKAFGAMTKMELIKKNIQEKPAGIQIINRLIKQGWVKQNNSNEDKRSKIIQITTKGLQVLDKQMAKIRQATQIVTGDLNYSEKMELIRLLKKLDDFHNPIFSKNYDSASLLENIMREQKVKNN